MYPFNIRTTKVTSPMWAMVEAMSPEDFANLHDIMREAKDNLSAGNYERFVRRVRYGATFDDLRSRLMVMRLENPIVRG